MTQVAKRDNTAPAAHATENELIDVLSSSLYPGAKPESIKLVLGYCRAAGLDPMQKPVHIVPMRVKGARGDYEWRDVVMPGIGLYRVQAARTGCYAGVSEPEFGPERELSFGESATTYPEWCRVTVRRLMPGGLVAEFTAVEYWLENYATKSRDSRAPNEMWSRRPRGQLAKCTEAQALRKAFPEIGAQPTSDEMEGQEIDYGPVPVASAQQTRPAPVAAVASRLPPYPDERFVANLPAWRNLIQSGRKSAGDLIAMIGSKGQLSAEQMQAIRDCEVVDAEQPQTEQGEI